MATDALNEDHIFGVRGKDAPIEEDNEQQTPNKVLASKSQDFHFASLGEDIIHFR